MAEDREGKVAPAYVPWRTLVNFINGLQDSGVPSQVNRSIMVNLSYSAQAQLLAALRFLGLIDAEGAPKSILNQMVEKDEKQRAPLIDQILRDRYGFVLAGHDLARVTPDELERTFRQEGITGSTVDRAVGFFLGAAEAAGYELSPHLKKRATSGGSTSRRSRPKKRQRPENKSAKPSGGEAADAKPKTMSEQLVDKFPDFDPTWDDAIKKQWFDGFQRLMGMANPPEDNGDRQ